MCTCLTNLIAIIPETSRAFDYCFFVKVLSVALVARTFSFKQNLWTCGFFRIWNVSNFLQVPDLGFLTLDVHYI